MSELPDRYLTGDSVWVRHYGRWRRGTVIAVDADNGPGLLAEFRAGVEDNGRLTQARFTVGADPAEVLSGAYARPAKVYCTTCEIRLRGNPGQPGAQVWQGHFTTAVHQERLPARPPQRRWLGQVVEPLTLVWVAEIQRRMRAHRYWPGAETTPCGLIQRLGTTITAETAYNEHLATPCARCWPAPTVRPDNAR
jgi:hypothetical protein